MPITVQQTWKAIDFSINEMDDTQSSATFQYIAFAEAADTEDDVIYAVRMAVPQQLGSEYGSLPRQSVSISSRLTEKEWLVDVVYADSGRNGQYEDEAVQEPQYNFEVSSATKKCVFPVAHSASFPNGTPAPETGINDGAGVDIIYPVSKFSETHFLTSNKVTATYKKNVAELVGKINSSSFKGYSKGQVLFLGCTGSRTGKEKWQVTFNFAVQTGQSGITIGDISGISKAPWDVIWCQYKEVKNSAETEVVKKVKAVHVDQVYEEASFSALGIGS